MQLSSQVLSSQVLSSQVLNDEIGTDTSAHRAEGRCAAIITQLLLGDFQERWEAAKQLRSLGQMTIAPLLELLQDEDLDWEVRWFAARILGEFDRPEVITALVNLLTTTADESLWDGAAEALTQIGPPAVSALIPLLSDAVYRPLAVSALCRIRHPAIILPLLQVVGDPDPDLRAAALEALGSFHDPQIASVLISALTDPVSRIRQEALKTLGRRRDWIERYNLVEVLAPRLWDGDLEVVQQAVLALGRLDTEDAAQALVALIQHPATPLSLQLTIVQALGWMAGEIALQGLQLAWEIPDIAVRTEVIHALGRTFPAEQQDQVLDRLMQWGRELPPVSQTVELRQAIALTLGRLGNPKAIPFLQGLQTDPHEGVQLHASAALRTLTGKALGASRVE